MTVSRLRILFHSTQSVFPYWGGSEKYWFEAILDPRFRDRFDIDVLLRPSPVTEKWGRELATLGAHVDLDFLRPGLVRKVAGFARRQLKLNPPATRQKPWRRLLADRRPDLVWFNVAGLDNLPWLADAAAACRSAGTAYWIILQYAPEHFFLPDDARTAELDDLVSHAARVVYIADRNRAVLEQCIGRRLENAWKGVNALTHDFVERAGVVAATPVRTQGAARFCNVARFDPMFKGQHLLLAALSDRKWLDRDWTLTMQGWGELPQLLRRLVTYFGLPTERVNVAPYSADVLPTFADADLAVMPSLSEGTPFSVVEALACGRPVVGTAVGGIGELVVERQTGFLAEATTVESIASAMDRAWDERQRWPAMGARGRDGVTKGYDQLQTLPLLMDELERCLARR